jgi:hypothetical protein
MVTNCKRCGSEYINKYRQIARNGAVTIILRCANCGENPTPATPFHGKAAFPEYETFPVLNDYREFGEPCAVRGCDDIETEYHHFAPRHLFGNDAEDYPGAYLCRRHHKEWHDKVTPEMAKRK